MVLGVRPRLRYDKVVHQIGIKYIGSEQLLYILNLELLFWLGGLCTCSTWVLCL